MGHRPLAPDRHMRSYFVADFELRFEFGFGAGFEVGLASVFDTAPGADGGNKAARNAGSSNRSFIPFASARSRASFALSPAMFMTFGSMPCAVSCRV